jgi:hypothetical protein
MKKLFNAIKCLLCSWVLTRRWRKAQRQAAKIIRRTKQKYPNSEGIYAADSWPPTSGTSTGYKATGRTTIKWGTEGILSSPYPSAGFYTVIRCPEKQLVDRTNLPNGTGITSTRVTLIDGVQWEVTVRDDSNMTPPTSGTTVSIVDVGGLLGTAGLVWTATVIDSAYEANLKAAGERSILVENLVLIDSQTSASQTPR